MAGGGNKGDKTTGQISLPPELTALANRNLQQAERAGGIGFVPYQGPTVAALNPMQVNAMGQNDAAMRAFGMTPAGVSASIPPPQTYAGGVQGYDPMGLYLQAQGKINPGQRAAIDSFAPAVSGAAKTAPKVTPTPVPRTLTRQQEEALYQRQKQLEWNRNKDWSSDR